MESDVQTTRIGAATVTVVNVYDIPENLQKLIDVPEDEKRSRDVKRLAADALLPVQCVLVQLARRAVLVDAGAYDPAFDHSGRDNYQPPPGLLARLAERGVGPGDVTHVVITHAHGDHFNLTTTARGDTFQPTFPGAVHYLGQADWQSPRLQGALADPSSLESRTFGVLDRAGRLEAVAGNRALGDAIQILAAPGETPGHQILRVHSEGQTLYCLGDLFHHPIEVEHPSWTAPWADRAANLASRRALAEAALAENARLVATHIPGFGRLKHGRARVVWTEG